MTEYEPGTEEICLDVHVRDDGNVSFSVRRISDNQRIYGVVLNPEVARKTAERLTLASWRAEGMKGT